MLLILDISGCLDLDEISNNRQVLIALVEGLPSNLAQKMVFGHLYCFMNLHASIYHVDVILP